LKTRSGRKRSTKPKRALRITSAVIAYPNYKAYRSGFIFSFLGYPGTDLHFGSYLCGHWCFGSFVCHCPFLYPCELCGCGYGYGCASGCGLGLGCCLGHGRGLGCGCGCGCVAAGAACLPSGSPYATCSSAHWNVLHGRAVRGRESANGCASAADSMTTRFDDGLWANHPS
jgi:hypothetical protein